MNGLPETVEEVRPVFGGTLPTESESTVAAIEQLRIERERRAGYLMRAYFPDEGRIVAGSGGSLLLLTFTPAGMTPLILSFLQEQKADARP